MRKKKKREKRKEKNLGQGGFFWSRSFHRSFH
jgi:hypothetical protein